MVPDSSLSLIRHNKSSLGLLKSIFLLKRNLVLTLINIIFSILYSVTKEYKYRV